MSRDHTIALQLGQQGKTILKKLETMLYLLFYLRGVCVYVCIFFFFLETESPSVAQAGVLECSGTILAHRNLRLLGLNYFPASAF